LWFFLDPKIIRTTTKTSSNINFSKLSFSQLNAVMRLIHEEKLFDSVFFAFSTFHPI